MKGGNFDQGKSRLSANLRGGYSHLADSAKVV